MLYRSIAGRYAIARVSSRVSYDAPTKVTRRDWVDLALARIFLVGLYTNYTIMISQKVPLPSAPSGIAGLILLWRWRDLITQRALIGLLVILTLYLVSILLAPNINWLSQRANGLIQLTYSATRCS